MNTASYTSTAFYEVIERRWPRGVPEDRVVDPVTCPFGRPVGRQLMPHFSPETRAALARVVQTCAGQRATPDTLETLRVMIASAIERERPDLTFRFRMDDPGDILVIWRYRPTPRRPMSIEFVRSRAAHEHGHGIVHARVGGALLCGSPPRDPVPVSIEFVHGRGRMGFCQECQRRDPRVSEMAERVRAYVPPGVESAREAKDCRPGLWRDFFGEIWIVAEPGKFSKPGKDSTTRDIYGPLVRLGNCPDLEDPKTTWATGNWRVTAPGREPVRVRVPVSMIARGYMVNILHVCEMRGLPRPECWPALLERARELEILVPDTMIQADPKPSVTPDLIERFRVFHARNPHLFYVLTSGNIDHGTAALTLDRANESQDSEAIDLADLVVRMSKTQRYKLVCALNRGRP